MKKAFWQLHIAVFLAGFTGILGKLITLNEGLLVWYRLLLTSATMWIIFSLTRRLQKVSIKHILQLGGVGFLSALHWVTFYGAIKTANVSVALVCFSAVGFFTAIFEPILMRTRFQRMDIFLGLVVIAGISLIFHFDPRYKTGIILGVLSAIFIAIAMIYIKKFVGRYNPQTVLTWQLSGGWLALTAVMPIYLYKFPTHYLIPDLRDWAWLLVLAWFCSVIAFQFTTHALQKLSAFTVNLTFNLEPVYGILLAFAVYHENQLLNKWFFIGFGLIAAALVIHVLLLIKEMPGRLSPVKKMEDGE
jgi:drug/metabolite transporter (DMT)-like permease